MSMLAFENRIHDLSNDYSNDLIALFHIHPKVIGVEFSSSYIHNLIMTIRSML